MRYHDLPEFFLLVFWNRMKFFRQYFEQETIRSIRNSYHMIDSIILELIFSPTE